MLRMPHGWLERTRPDGAPLTERELIVMIMSECGVSGRKARRLLAAEHTIIAILAAGGIYRYTESMAARL